MCKLPDSGQLVPPVLAIHNFHQRTGWTALLQLIILFVGLSNLSMQGA